MNPIGEDANQRPEKLKIKPHVLKIQLNREMKSILKKKKQNHKCPRISDKVARTFCRELFWWQMLLVLIIILLVWVTTGYTFLHLSTPCKKEGTCSY